MQGQAMRIDGTGRIIPAGRAKTDNARKSQDVFQPETSAQSRRTPVSSSSVGASTIDALIALQSVEDATSGRRKAVKRASLLLDALEEIRADLLAGRVSEGRLNRAVALLCQAKSHSEPGLDELVAEIELRVRVELAKLGRYPEI